MATEITIMDGIETILKADSLLRSWAATLNSGRVSISKGNTAQVAASFPAISIGYLPDQEGVAMLNGRGDIEQVFFLHLQLSTIGGDIEDETNMITFKDHVKRILAASFTLSSTVDNSFFDEIVFGEDLDDADTETLSSSDVIISLETLRETA